MEKLDSHEVAELYIGEFYRYFSPIGFKKYCLEYKPGLSTAYEHFKKITADHYNFAKTAFRIERDINEDSGMKEEFIYDNGWKASFKMIKSKTITHGVDYSEEYYKSELIKISDFHFD